MDLIDYLIEHISPLSWTVKGTGFLVIALLIMRAIGQFFSFRWIKAVTSLIVSVVILLLLARFGADLDQFITKQPNGSSNNTVEQSG